MMNTIDELVQHMRRSGAAAVPIYAEGSIEPIFFIVRPDVFARINGSARLVPPPPAKLSKRQRDRARRERLGR